MTEQDLIDLGFEKQEEVIENGGYHYYTNGELLSNDNEEAGEDNWEVTLYGEVYDFRFTEIGDLRMLVPLLEKAQVETGFNMRDLND